MSDSPVADVIMRAFDAACSYEDYLAASPKHADAWRSMGERIALTPTQREMLSGFTRQMRVLVVSGICCGDCVRQGPAMAAIAAACRSMVGSVCPSQSSWPRMASSCRSSAIARFRAIAGSLRKKQDRRARCQARRFPRMSWRGWFRTG